MDSIFHIDSYDYQLPEAQIAQEPTECRDGSRLLVVDGVAGITADSKFADLPSLIRPEDILVLNDTKVFPARLLGRKESGGQAELLLLHYPDSGGGESESFSFLDDHQAEVRGLVKSSKRPKAGSRLLFGTDLSADVLAILDNGEVQVLLRWQGDLDEVLNRYGVMPLPPYIRRDQGEAESDRERYQTIYARTSGAIAAPTAGLHFSDQLLAEIKGQGTQLTEVTLHVGYGTFAPVRAVDVRDHLIHAEYVTVSETAVQAILRAQQAGGRVWAVGTTSARALEFASVSGRLEAVSGWCSLYIYPGYTFRVVDNLITNFHLPKSSLLFMVSAFAGYDQVMTAYRQALALGYRFYSYGDAMALVRK
ncbi:MAG: tRNA preQ1(34) S-adenosylmethionine ribosyltransferase-isomerase QueA [Proteobacteria bacterium]|nr:tRNA preQ1(34) S-adenosylmethionine ribosyltransferase-isomerase QueA [Desulfobulbaceae bacterium]MBU4153289.1 tRNA preQ1(34) S-adenosylmethionine ribosyltransferase-isomerase QueA [Pseudomonadota bacterium]MDP2104698.1 tRNA preQ1(34) S-adenosylmethionine ribosyltransferase-isomerase QueA [Desulfobulbaceae bacterium]